LATEQNVIIKFTSDTTGLQPAIEQLRLIGKITDEDAKRISEINAEQQKFNSTVNETTNEFTDFQKTFKNLSADIKAQVIVEAANQLKEFSQEATKGGTQIKSLKGELRELKAQIASGSLGADEMKAATKRAAELTDHLGDVQQKIKALSSDTKKIDTIVEAFKGLAAVTAITQGAIGLLGKENKEFEKTLLKVQSAMALLNGVQEISVMLKGEGIAKTYALAAAEGVAAAASKVLGVTITTSMAAATGGISLLVAGLAYLVYELNQSEEAVESFDSKVAKFNDRIALNQKINDMLIAMNTNARERELKQNEIAKVRELQQLEDKYSKDIKAKDLFEKAKITLDEFYAFKATEINKKYDDDAAKKKLAANQKALAAQAKALEENNKQWVAAQKAIEDENTKYFENEKAGLEAWAKMSSEISQEEYNARKALKAQEAKDSQDWFDAEIARQLQFNEQAKNQAKALEDDVKNAVFATAVTLANTLFTLTSQNIKATEDAELNSIQTRRDKDLQARNITEAQKIKIEERAQRQMAQVKMKAWRQQQQADIAQATINGAIAITSALTTKPIEAAIIAAGLVAVQTAAQVAIIKNTPVPKFAKGTMKVLGEGTGTSDHVPALLSHGESVFTASTTSDYYPALSAIFDRKVSPQIANDLLTDLANGSFNINPEYHSTSSSNLDYERLANVVKQGQSKVVINLDEKGFMHYQEKSAGKTQYVNSKFKYVV
jgi:hypothetical protein